MDKRQKMINSLAAFSNEREAICPHCGGYKFKIGYVETNKKGQMGFGAFWCEECRQALILSRVILTDEKARAKIIPALPKDLNFV